jgi:hypothetical protein
MLLTLLAFVVGGHQFTVPNAPTVVPGLELPIDLSGRSGYRATVNVTTPQPGAQGVIQCSPDGVTWSTLAVVSFATAGSVSTSPLATSLDAIPMECRRDVRIRSLLQNGAGAQVRVTYLTIYFQ